MFVGIKEIKGALGRFSLIVGVVGLITLLVVMLTGLTAGLGKQNTSALEALDPQSVTFNDMDEPSYSTSRIPADEVPVSSTPLGTGQTMLTTEDGTEISAAVLGLPKGTVLPTGVTLGDTAVASSSLGLTEGRRLASAGRRLASTKPQMTCTIRTRRCCGCPLRPGRRRCTPRPLARCCSTAMIRA